jgi:uncharacterized membrane protein
MFPIDLDRHSQRHGWCNTFAERLRQVAFPFEGGNRRRMVRQVLIAEPGACGRLIGLENPCDIDMMVDGEFDARGPRAIWWRRRCVFVRGTPDRLERIAKMVAPVPELPPIEEPPRASVAGARVLWVIRVLSICAAGVAGYLAVTSFLLKGLPLGCGAGSGCDEVLQSKWSALFGIPVGSFALAAYLAVLVATFFVRKGTVLFGLAVAISASALWFIVLQVFVVKAYCIWCLTDHALGLAMSVTAFVYVDSLASADSSASIRSGRAGAVVGLGLTSVLIVMQVIWGASASELARLPETGNFDTGPGPERRIGVLNGKLQIDVHDVPVLGSPDAKTLVVIMYDYCCPHCRRTHGYLLEGLDRYPGQFGLVLLPLPLNEDCNRVVLLGETDRRFKDACELARLALAVWRADPSAFPTYDAWLYEPETPRTAGEARAKAEELVGHDALDAALAQSWVDRRIAEDVDAFAQISTHAIPLIFSPGMDAVMGRPESAEELFGILEKELGLRVSPE